MRLCPPLLILATAALLGACGDDAAPAPSAGGCHVAEGGTVEITARDIEWDTDCLEAPAGEPLTIVVENEDATVNHNFHLSGAPGSPTTPLEPGPATQELQLDEGLPPGSYEFVCDIHPTMVGTLDVAAANADP